MHWLGSAVRRRAGCNGKAPDSPACVREEPAAAKKSMGPPPAVQLLIDAIPEPELKPEPMP
eukprot:1966357-Alexandrium_andersonii.AAC.1